MLWDAGNRTRLDWRSYCSVVASFPPECALGVGNGMLFSIVSWHGLNSEGMTNTLSDWVAYCMVSELEQSSSSLGCV